MKQSITYIFLSTIISVILCFSNVSFVYADSGTNVSVDHISKFTQFTYLPDITISEKNAGSFNAIKNSDGTYSSAKIKLQLCDDFVFIYSRDTCLKPGTNRSGSSNYFRVNNGNTIEIELPVDWISTKDENGNIKNVGTVDPASIVICELRVDPAYYGAKGDILLTVSGKEAGITTQTIKVGEATDYGLTMTAKETAPIVTAGSTGVKAATVTIKEDVKDSWVSSRNLDFSLPAGITITSFSIDNIRHVWNNEINSHIVNNGEKLVIYGGLRSDYDYESDGISFDLTLYLSVAQDFSGDIILTPNGAGFSSASIGTAAIATTNPNGASSIISHNILGDLDGDGMITVLDAVQILKKVSDAGYKFPIE